MTSGRRQPANDEQLFNDFTTEELARFLPQAGKERERARRLKRKKGETNENEEANTPAKAIKHRKDQKYDKKDHSKRLKRDGPNTVAAIRWCGQAECESHYVTALSTI